MRPAFLCIPLLLLCACDPPKIEKDRDQADGAAPNMFDPAKEQAEMQRQLQSTSNQLDAASADVDAAMNDISKY